VLSRLDPREEVRLRSVAGREEPIAIWLGRGLRQTSRFIEAGRAGEVETRYPR
jgi:hypothetical protein